MGFEADKDPLEDKDEAWVQRTRFKSTPDFVSMMDGYIRQLPELILSRPATALALFMWTGNGCGPGSLPTANTR